MAETVKTDCISMDTVCMSLLCIAVTPQRLAPVELFKRSAFPVAAERGADRLHGYFLTSMALKKISEQIKEMSVFANMPALSHVTSASW